VTPPITLTIPHRKPFHGIARLVVGGLAARLDLSYEHLEDLQLALETVLEGGGYAVGSDVTVELQIRDDGVDVRIGPLDGTRLSADLEEESEDGLTLSRLLATVVQRVDVEAGSGGHWLRLEKSARVNPEGLT
jgi:hypothetical protein